MYRSMSQTGAKQGGLRFVTLQAPWASVCDAPGSSRRAAAVRNECVNGLVPCSFFLLCGGFSSQAPALVDGCSQRAVLAWVSGLFLSPKGSNG